MQLTLVVVAGQSRPFLVCDR